MKNVMTVVICLFVSLVVGIACANVQNAAAKPEVGVEATSSPSILWRQGSDPNSWAGDGNINYAVAGDAEMQVGASHIPRGEGYIFVTFPSSYDYAPLVYVTPLGTQAVYVTNVGQTGFEVQMFPESPLATDVVFNWMAIGQ